MTGSQVTKYYFAGTQRVAMRSGNNLSYLLTDHLGSTSLTTDVNGTLVSEMRYKPWGEVRYTSGTTPTNYTYTGQYSNMGDFGLMFYNARWYDPSVGRFAQADTIVPGGVQGLDRYAYVNNSPLNYFDPSGHRACDDQDENGNCIDFELKNKRLQNELKRFIAPKKVEPDKMKKVGIDLHGYIGEVELTPGEYNMFLIAKLRTHDGLDNVKLWQMYNILLEAMDTTEQRFSGLSEDFLNDPADAFRHAYWNALITREFGADFAEQFTTAHETSPISVREQTFMDLHNNQVGINIALANPDATDEELQAAVLESLYSGELYVWDDNNIYFSDQCPDCWWRAK